MRKSALDIKNKTLIGWLSPRKGNYAKFFFKIQKKYFFYIFDNEKFLSLLKFFPRNDFLYRWGFF